MSMRNDLLATFTDSLVQLRQALADADPLAAAPEAAPVSATAETLAATFASASAGERPRLLLRALDDAIAAVEIATRLADNLHGADEPSAGADEGADGSLRAAYQAFTESQPAYAALYHYRNALATTLRLTMRPQPPTSQPETPTAEPQA